jgi:hypothetical protein
MSARLSSVFPRPSASDPDDVVWTLQTAAVQWQRGLRADAIVWVRKAADLSLGGGRTDRADELRNQAARLAEFLWTDPEEPGVLAPASGPSPQSAARRVISDEDDDEIIEVEELDDYELEFTETDLPTPEDAAADISPEDLQYYQSGEGAQPGQGPLPDDLDLRSDSPPPAAGGSLTSISPELDDSDFISVQPESDSGDLNPETEVYLDVNPESLPPMSSSVPAAASSRPAAPAVSGHPSDLPTQPRIERPPPFRPFQPAVESAETARLPTLPSPAQELAAELEAEDASPYLLQTVPPAGGSLLSEEVSPQETPAGIDGLTFESVEALADLPEEAHAELAAGAHLRTLTSSQEFVLREGAALITHGQVHVTLPFSYVSGERVASGAVVAVRCSVEAGPLRLIADAEQTRLVTWTDQQLSNAMRDCPWVEDDLRQLADRLQAHAAAGLGPLGERLDDALRATVYERLQVRVLAPDESVAERGKPLKGLFIVAVGNLAIGDSGIDSITSGQFVFPSCVIGGELPPDDVKAGPQGAVVLFATRPVAHELMMSVPPLLELLAG